jgi:hypothetical protein
MLNPMYFCQKCGEEYPLFVEICLECGFEPVGRDSDEYEEACRQYFEQTIKGQTVMTEAAEVEKAMYELADKACRALGVDPDKVEDPVGPVTARENVIYAMYKHAQNIEASVPVQGEREQVLLSALRQIILAVEDEAYKITAGQPLCKHIAALNEVHELASEAIAQAQETQ